MEKTKKPNIFFLLIDSFRADKFYGKDKTSLTPNLDLLIKKGVYFTQTINSSPASTSAIASVLTSKWPHKVIVRGKKNHVMSHGEPNFINRLNELGYNTIALTPEYFNYAKLTTDFKKSLQFHGGLNDGIGQQIINIIDELKSPWFFFIHLLDIHGTAKNLPKQFDQKKYGFNRYERKISSMDPWFGKIFEKIDQKNTLSVITADHSTDRGIYTLKQEEIKASFNQNNLQPFANVAKKFLSKSVSKKLRGIYINKKINTKKQKQSAALQNLSELDPFQKRIQSNLINPGFNLFDDRFRIPLLFFGLDLPSKIINQQIRSVDIFPSIFDIIEEKSEMEIDGSSVMPIVSGKFIEEKPAFMQIITNWLTTKSSSDINLIGVRYNGFKYFRARHDPSTNVGLYDLRKDPLEVNNLASSCTEKIIEMEQILSQFEKNTKKEINNNLSQTDFKMDNRHSNLRNGDE